MKVLLVHNRYRSGSPSGEDRVVDREAVALREHGHTVQHFERFSDDIANGSLFRKALLPAQVIWSETARRSLKATLEEFRPHVVHIHNTFPLLSPSILYACHDHRVPVVATMHNFRMVCPRGDLFRDGSLCQDCVGRLPLPALRHRCYRNSALATAPLAAGIVIHRNAWHSLISAYIFLSTVQRDILADGVPPERSFVKPNFVPHLFTPSSGPRDYVVYAGRLSVEKGVDLLMKAWELFRHGTEHDSLRLVLAGAGPLEEQVEEWARGHTSVDWVGLLEPSTFASILAQSRAAIVPSRCLETFGLVAVEAMAAGVPPVAPAHGPFVDLIRDGVDGSLFTPGSADALAGVLRDLVGQPTRYESLGRAARLTYEQRYTPEANVKQLVDIYEFALAQPVFGPAE